MLLQAAKPPNQPSPNYVPPLHRVQWFASGLLVLCIITLIFAKLFEAQYPFLGFVAAFAEAATIGGCADWYAVVALFRHPLGLPIPHTAIIAKNQTRIAVSLARFISHNFLSEGPVRQKLQGINFAGHMTEWLGNTARVKSTLKFIILFLPQLMQKADLSGFKANLTGRMKDSLSKTDITPFIVNLLNNLIENGHHQKLLDGLLTGFGKLIIQPQSIEAIGVKIRQELPSVFKFFKADTYLLDKIIGSTAQLINDVQADPEHPLRAEVDAVLADFIQKLKTSSDYHEWLDKAKLSLLNRPEIAQLFQGLWDSLLSFIETDAVLDDSVIQRQILDLIHTLSDKLLEDDTLQLQINTRIVSLCESIIALQKDSIGEFISNQVKSWDAVHMTKLIENSVGRDLQYIRFNGTLIGGTIGIVLYCLKLGFGL